MCDKCVSASLHSEFVADLPILVSIRVNNPKSTKRMLLHMTALSPWSTAFHFLQFFSPTWWHPIQVSPRNGTRCIWRHTTIGVSYHGMHLDLTWYFDIPKTSKKWMFREYDSRFTSSLRSILIVLGDCNKIFYPVFQYLIIILHHVSLNSLTKSKHLYFCMFFLFPSENKQWL